MVELFGGGRREGRGRRAIGRVRAALAAAAALVAVGCQGTADEATGAGGPVAAETGTAGSARATGATATGATGEPVAVESVAAETGGGDARVPGLDPAWEAGVGPSVGAVPASLGARTAGSQSLEGESLRPQEWRSRRAPPWKGERLEGRVRPKQRPTPQAPQVKP